jgi:hypothetical protein
MKTNTDSRVLKYFGIGLYVIGCCHYGHTEPYRTVEVVADSLCQAMEIGRAKLSPSLVEHICHVSTRPNPEFQREQSRWAALRVDNLPTSNF